MRYFTPDNSFYKSEGGTQSDTFDENEEDFDKEYEEDEDEDDEADNSMTDNGTLVINEEGLLVLASALVTSRPSRLRRTNRPQILPLCCT